jgi:hypothetical protein
MVQSCFRRWYELMCRRVASLVPPFDLPENRPVRMHGTARRCLFSAVAVLCSSCSTGAENVVQSLLESDGSLSLPILRHNPEPSKRPTTALNDRVSPVPSDTSGVHLLQSSTYSDSLSYWASSDAKVRIRSFGLGFNSPAGNGRAYMDGVAEFSGHSLKLTPRFALSRVDENFAYSEPQSIDPQAQRHNSPFVSLGELIRDISSGGYGKHKGFGFQTSPLAEVCGVSIVGRIDAEVHWSVLPLPGFPLGDWGFGYGDDVGTQQNESCTAVHPNHPCTIDGDTTRAEKTAGWKNFAIAVDCQGGQGGGGGTPPPPNPGSGGGGFVYVTVCTGVHVFDENGNWLYDQILECHEEVWVM